MPPAYHIDRIVSLQRQLFDDTFREFYGVTLIGAVLDDFCQTVAAGLPGVISYPVLAASLQHLAGVEFHDSQALELSWRLAGNLHRLKAGTPVYPWSGQLEEEAVPVVIEALARQTIVRHRKDQPREEIHGGLVRLRFLGGLPAGRVCARFWSYRFIQLIRVPLGFHRFDRVRYSVDPARLRGGNHPLQDARELVQLRFLGPVLADGDPSGPTLVGDKIRATAAMKTYNQSIFALRERRGFVCPKAYTKPCYLCECGYNTCPAACHPVDFVSRHCPACKRDNRPFDPDCPTPVCVDCAARST